MERKIELKVINISNSQAQAPAFAMLLQEIEGKRQLPIIIGPAEAQAITFKLNNISPIRPLTHDLFTTTLNLFGISISEILIYKAQDGVFYSQVFFRQEEKEFHIDSRSSDAIALAVRFNAPIYIFESILEKECISLEQSFDPDEDDDDLESKDIKYLKNYLTKAIKEENYELASIIRDEIARRQ